MAIKLGSRLAMANNNPGNLRYAGQEGASQGEGGFARFESPEAGYQAVKKQIDLDASRGHTVSSFVSKYAPPVENDTNTYIAQATKDLGVTPDTPVKDVDSDKLAKFIIKKESSSSVGTRYKVKFETGQTVVFDEKPSQADIDEVSQKLNLSGGGQEQGGYDTTPAPSGTIQKTEPKKPEDIGLGDELSGRATDFVKGASRGIEGLVGGFTGKISPLEATKQTLSGAVRTAGAVGGALADTTNALIEKTPVVNKVFGFIEKLAGKGAESFLNTDLGQNVAQEVVKFQEKNPELSKDIGAGFDALSAIPILKGLNLAKNLALNTAAKTMERAAVNSVAKKLEKSAFEGSFKTAQKLVKDRGVFKEMLSPKVLEHNGQKIVLERVIPDVAGGKYVTQEAEQAIKNNTKTLTEAIKANLAENTHIAKPTGILSATVKSLPNSQLTKQEVLDIAKKMDRSNRGLWDKFGRGKATLEEVNDLRSSLGTSMRSSVWDNYDVAFDKKVGKNLYSQMAEYIKTAAPSTRPLFAAESKQFAYQEILKKLVNGKIAKSGMLGRATRVATTGVGEALGGGLIKLPIVGALGANQASNMATRAAAGGLSQNLLIRAQNPLLPAGAGGKLGRLIGASLASKAKQKAKQKADQQVSPK